MSNIQEPRNLTDAVLIKRLEELSANENQSTVAVLLHLAEVDRRKLYLPLGYSSLFAYCTSSAGKLKYADTAALRRITCARAITSTPSRKFFHVVKHRSGRGTSKIVVIPQQNLASAKILQGSARHPISFLGKNLLDVALGRCFQLLHRILSNRCLSASFRTFCLRHP